MSSKFLRKFTNSFNSYDSAPQCAAMWVKVIEQAKIDLTHPREEVRKDAHSFLFDPDGNDDRLSNLLHMLGLDGELGKVIMREYDNQLAL